MSCNTQLHRPCQIPPHMTARCAKRNAWKARSEEGKHVGVPEVLAPWQTHWRRLSNVDAAMMNSDRLVNDGTTVRIEFLPAYIPRHETRKAILGFHRAFLKPSKRHRRTHQDK
ncbi:hypothetical protein CY34DRAFT_803125 [Suillus luteus UH-Slu-Lm8-n1]|uniref:Unplaced genomic scaffold CY34scaffold_68, whole genome shotgun sequence n=1 Tax=Suillus luteus UH-Slu-Lm8-n1 TaxID=930992 RepID=A0A0D0BCM8_9AGAM|nr:hypothetical protein CY34DRAFT_803125 [Suillus luteus UH-Slu-Lm8-n1]